MSDNHTYNLMKQLVQEQKSLWRITHNYTDDAGDCASCQEYWGKLKKDKEKHTEELTNLLKKHM